MSNAISSEEARRRQLKVPFLQEKRKDGPGSSSNTPSGHWPTGLANLVYVQFVDDLSCVWALVES